MKWLNVLFRTETPLEHIHSTVSDKKSTYITTSGAPVEARSEQPVTTDVYSRPHVIQENGTVVQQQHSFHSETREPR